MSKRKRISFLETLESRKAFAHLGCEWASPVEGLSRHSGDNVPSYVSDEAHSQFFYVAMERAIKDRGEPRDRSRGLVGEGEAGRRVETNRSSNETTVGSSSQQGRGEQESALVIVFVQGATRQSPPQENPGPARFENTPPMASNAVAQPTSPARPRFTEPSANGIAPLVQQERQQDGELSLAIDRDVVFGVQPRSLFESLTWSNPRVSMASDSQETLDYLMSKMGESGLEWSFPFDSLDDLDAEELNRDRTSLLARSTSDVTVPSTAAKSWETIYTQGLPIPNGMVHLQVGELEGVSVAKTRITPQVASLSPSSFELIQWFAGSEIETRADIVAESDGDTQSIDRDAWSLRDNVTDAVFIILAGGLVTERVRRSGACRSFAYRLRCIALGRIGASRVQSTRLSRGGDDSFLGGS